MIFYCGYTHNDFLLWILHLKLDIGYFFPLPGCCEQCYSTHRNTDAFFTLDFIVRYISTIRMAQSHSHFILFCYLI